MCNFCNSGLYKMPLEYRETSKWCILGWRGAFTIEIKLWELEKGLKKFQTVWLKATRHKVNAITRTQLGGFVGQVLRKTEKSRFLTGWATNKDSFLEGLSPSKSEWKCLYNKFLVRILTLWSIAISPISTVGSSTLSGSQFSPVPSCWPSLVLFPLWRHPPSISFYADFFSYLRKTN